MKILVTGSSGMLGNDLCGVLSAEHDLIGVDVSGSVSENRPRIVYEADITDKYAVKKIFLKEKPDVVIHSAAWTDVDGCELDPVRAEEVNVKGTLSIAEASRDVSAYLIALSTDYVFDGTKNASYTEDDATNPLSVYGRTKLEAENMIKKVLTSFIVLRTSALYGPNGRNFVNSVIDKASKGEKLNIVNDQITAPTYTYDLADSIRRVINNRSSFDFDILNVCNSGSCSWYEFAVKIIEREGLEGCSLEPITSSQLGRPAQRPCFSVLDNTRFCDSSGHKLRIWEDALIDYLDKRK